MMKPVDLAEYADRYKLAWDEAASIPEQTQEDREWLRLIPCKFGTIFSWSDAELAAHVVGAKKSKQADRLPFVKVAQGGGPGCAEVVVTFSPAYIDGMAVFMGARRRRRLAPAHRKTLIQRGAVHRFQRNTGQTGVSSAWETSS